MDLTPLQRKELNDLLANLQPRLHEPPYVFCSVGHLPEPPYAQALAMFREEESLAMVLLQAEADALGIDYDYVAAWLTLEVMSPLESVGLTASVAGILASEGISCNVIAAYRHDHLFVPYEDGDKTLMLLKRLSREANEGKLK